MAENPWTEILTTQVTDLWNEGLSAGRIAAEMKMTRNMIIGKVHRLKLAKREERKPSGGAIKRSYPKTRAPSVKPAIPRIKPELFIVNVADVEPLHINLMQLTATTCRYPYGEAAPFTFCGCEVQPGKPDEPKKPYCPAHAELCKGKSEPRRQNNPIRTMPGWGIKSNMRVFA